VKLPVPDAAGTTINFKYYQRIDGSFTVPADSMGQSVEASFFEARATQPKLSQKVDLPS